MWIDIHYKRNTASDWPQGLANGHLFTYCSVGESKRENELFLFTQDWVLKKLIVAALSFAYSFYVFLCAFINYLNKWNLVTNIMV